MLFISKRDILISWKGNFQEKNLERKIKMEKLLAKFKANPTKENAYKILVHVRKFPRTILLLSVSEHDAVKEVCFAEDLRILNSYK